ncbi:hypothetical protein QTI66_02365 [Variovorax sp. J22R133]|uniref:hypothetical protein n=1 Tax=Variovorax brevis TaxID=3053503 RepID=UPI002577EFA0|nr:hypothetical protein [Variovorax sp. J22R133]MDM0110970.1 hypothetical protein [Variovorax sp. J22R133]
MTPQSAFTVVAAVADGREGALRVLLEGMNLHTQPGMADAKNALVPFGLFERLHFARFALLDDSTLGDLEAFDLPRPQVPLLYLAFVGECDGPGDEQLAEFATVAGAGLAKIFGHCAGFGAGTDLVQWMKAHDLPIGANYVNRIGRTVRQVHEESALQRALFAQAPRGAAARNPQEVRRHLLEFVDQQRKAGALTLTPPAPTPTDWKIRNLIHLLGIPLVLIVLLPLWIVLAILGAIALRRHEKRDPECCPRPDAHDVRAMQRLEDHDLTNSFTALGAVKPGWFRRVLVMVVLLAIDYAARHVFYKGHLARIQTIHFARWVFMDNRTRVLFCSNYDGSHESYMDDFVNKAAWGLNLVFSNGFGWPRTDWLILGGARRELLFKHYQRRHQLPTQVWYKAYPGLTLGDLERNHRIRQGVDAPGMSDEEALDWLRLI